MEITTPRIRKISVGDCLEASRCIKPRCDLERQSFDVRQPILTRRLDSLLIETHGVDISIFNPSDFTGNKVTTVLKRFSAIINPGLKLLVVTENRFPMLALLVR